MVRAHTHLLHRRAQQTFPSVIQNAVLTHFSRPHIAVTLQVGPRQSFTLAHQRFFHACSNRFQFLTEAVTR